MCVSVKSVRIIYHLKKCAVTIEAMAAANFSRDVLEISTTYTNDLIDLESVIENPVVDEYDKICFLNAEKYIVKQKLYNHCDWLKIGKKER